MNNRVEGVLQAIGGLGKGPAAGRRSRVLLGASVNGSFAEVMACTLSGEVVERQRQHTGDALDDVLDVLARQICVMYERMHGAGYEVCAIGVGVPGPVDINHGVLRYAEAIGWHESPVRDMLGHRLAALGMPAIPMLVERAAACTALYRFAAEHLEGEAPLLYIHVGHSIAMAAVADHGVLRGRNGLAGAIAHMPVLPDGPLCSCGRRGCANAVLTLRAMEQACGLPVADMQAQADDERVQAVLRETGGRLGRLLFALCLQYEPARLFVGGTAFQISEVFARTAQETLATMASELGIPVATPQLIPLEQSNVALGAAIATLRQLWPHPQSPGANRQTGGLMSFGPLQAPSAAMNFRGGGQMA